jgi:hypothetical protein
MRTWIAARALLFASLPLAQARRGSFALVSSIGAVLAAIVAVHGDGARRAVRLCGLRWPRWRAAGAHALG